MSKTGGGKGTNQYQIKGTSKRVSNNSHLEPDVTLENVANIAGWEKAEVQYGETPIDEDAREHLTSKCKNITTLNELNELESQNIAAALTWLDEHPFGSTDELLDQINLRELHRRMFEDVWTWAGKLRLRETNIGVPPETITERWAIALGNTRMWVEQHTYSLEEIGVRFHHDMVAIHCFPNGNGRHARIAANELGRLIGLGYRPYSWGRKGGQSAEIVRKRYLETLAVADRTGDFGPLVHLALS